MKSAWKTASWLAVSGVLITATAWFESGSFWVGLMAALWACTLKTPVYWLHEVCWEGRKKPAARRQPLEVLPCVCCPD
jgi:uncharacterized membrane protein